MLKLENLKKVYDGVTILENINLNIEDGEIISILGPSGCGKTTLLNLILGIAEADGGHIFFNGQDITDVPMEKRGFNIVFQDYALFPNLNVYENITYGLRNNPGISTEEEVQELIELLGLEEHLNKRIDQLSGGQKQRTALARTMVMKPKILLLDEPTNDLDVETLSSLESALLEFPGCSVVISHDRMFLDRVATHILAWEGTDENPGNWYWFEGNFEAYQENRVARLGEDAAQPHRIRRKLTRD